MIKNPFKISLSNALTARAMYRKSDPLQEWCLFEVCIRYIVASIFFDNPIWFYVYKIKRTTSKRKNVCIGAYTLYIRIQYAHMYREESKEKRISKTDHCCYHELAIFMPSVYIQPFFPSNLCESVRKWKKVQNELYEVFFLVLFFFLFLLRFLKSPCILRHLVFREDRYRRNL